MQESQGSIIMKKQQLRIGAAEHAILQALGTYHYLSADQVCRLLYSRGSLTYVYAKLKLLTDAGYTLQSFLPRMTKSGSAPSVYTYGRKGYRYLQELGFALPSRFHATEAQQHAYIFLSHTLAVNDVLIAL